MNDKNKIAFLGGDGRQYIAAEKLFERGFCARAFWGRGARGELAETLSEVIADCSAVVLPLPVSLDGVRLNSSVEISLEELLEGISTAGVGLIIGGRIPDGFRARAEERGIECVDYFTSESFLQKNAYLTAEAALSLAMRNIAASVRGSRFAVAGYGRIGALLSRLLVSLGAELTVCARKERDLAAAELLGCGTLRLCEGKSPVALASGYKVIFNTVPARIFGREFLSRLDKDTLIIELASLPGGIDAEAARSLGTRVLWASALPGKYAPESAGALVAECVGEALERRLER